MSLLLLDRAQPEVKTEGDALALYEGGVRRGTVPITLIDRGVIQGAQTRLDSGVMDDAFCRQWALALTRAKLARQRRTLRHLQTERPDAREPLFDALQTLDAVVKNLNGAGQAGVGDLAATPTLDSLRGHEGTAAAHRCRRRLNIEPP